MAYCTLADMQEQIDNALLISLTDDADAGAVDTDKTDRAIADADSLIDGYCGKRYAVPFTTVPELIRKFSVDIGIYNLYARRQGAPEDRRQRYKDAVDYLKGVARGENTLGEDDPDATPSEGHTPQIASNTRVFSRDNLKGF